MNYGELKTAIAQWAHRTDLGDQMGIFAQNVTERLNQRFGLNMGPLVADTDTNIVLENNGNVYLYGTLREQATYTHNAVAAQAYESLYQVSIADYNINYAGDEWDTDTLVMTPTEEA